MDEADERTLRAKYLDWCSARVAERFLDLSSEEIYSMAYGAADEEVPETGSAQGPGEGERLPPPDSDSYRALVQRVTEALLGRMSLPSFDTWREEYAASPGRFEAEMLGFWRDASGGAE